MEFILILVQDDLSEVLVDNIISSSLKKAQEEFDPVNNMAQPLKSFFRRSNSMTFLGCTDPDPFSVLTITKICQDNSENNGIYLNFESCFFQEPMVTALPLADKPHLLQPNARKEELFGRPRQHARSENSGEIYEYDYTFHNLSCVICLLLLNLYLQLILVIFLAVLSDIDTVALRSSYILAFMPGT